MKTNLPPEKEFATETPRHRERSFYSLRLCASVAVFLLICASAPLWLIPPAFSQTILTAPGLASFKKKPAVGGGGGGFTYTIVTNAIAQGSGSAVVNGIDTTGANLLAVNLDWFSSTKTFTDSKGNTYTSGISYGGTSGIYSNVWLYCINPSVGSGHSFTNNASFTVLNVVAAKKSSGTPAFDSQNGLNYPGGNTTTLQPGNVTPAVNNELILAAFCCNDAGGGTATNATIDSSFVILGQTKQGGNALYGGAASKIQTTAGSENPTWTFAHTINTASLSILCFK
jgi:hypothetical protein